jgi:serine/threonine-protein kinase
MAARFGAGKDPGSLDKTAKAGLLVPEAGFDLEAACQMADQVVTLGKDSPFVYYFQLVKGLAEYRAGHFASAVNWVGKSMGKPATVGGLSPAWNRDVAACSVQAMAQYKLKRSDEARAALARGVAIAQTNLPQRDSGDLGEDWADWLVAHILLREAQALIEAPSAPVAEPSVPK